MDEDETGLTFDRFETAGLLPAVWAASSGISASRAARSCALRTWVIQCSQNDDAAGRSVPATKTSAASVRSSGSCHASSLRAPAS